MPFPPHTPAVSNTTQCPFLPCSKSHAAVPSGPLFVGGFKWEISTLVVATIWQHAHDSLNRQLAEGYRHMTTIPISSFNPRLLFVRPNPAGVFMGHSDIPYIQFQEVVGWFFSNPHICL